jgi:hypothetical protein
VTEEEDVGLGHLRSTFSEAEGTASSGVEDDAGAAVIPYEIAGGGALILRFGTAGAEDLHGDS